MAPGRAVWLVAGTLTCTLLGDAAVAVHLRAEERERARAAAARVVDEAWVDEVRTTAVDVLRVRAPIMDAANLVLADLGAAVRYDVYVRGGAAADFAQLEERLRATSAPEKRKAVQGEFVTALQAMAQAVRDLADEKDRDVEDETRAFTAAAAEWDALVADHVARDLRLGTTQRGDAALTHAGRIFRWSSACARGILDDEQVPEAENPDQAAEAFEDYAATLDRTLDALLTVPVEGEALQAHRELDPALRGVRSAVGAMNEFAAALRGDSRQQVEEALIRLDQADPLLEATSGAFEVAGSGVCADYFDPGLVDGSPPPDDVTRT